MRMVMMQLVFDLILHVAGFVLHLLSQALFVVAVVRAGCPCKLYGKVLYRQSLAAVLSAQPALPKDCYDSYNILMLTHQRTRLPRKSNGRKNARQFSLIGRGSSNDGFVWSWGEPAGRDFPRL